MADNGHLINTQGEPMSAQNVWTCLQHYRRDSAKQIERLYDNHLPAIIAVLEKYGDKNKYVGHASQINKTDAKENSSLSSDLDKAFTYLKNNAPAKGAGKDEKKSGPDMEKKAASLKKADDLKRIVSATSDLGKMRDLLDEANPKWRDMNDVWDAYRLKYRDKKGSDPDRKKR